MEQKRGKRSLQTRAKSIRGISPLVATVIILAITITAGLMLYNLVLPLINVPTQEIKCQDITFELDKPASCIEADRVKISIDRTKSSSEEPDVIAWNIILDIGEGTKDTTTVEAEDEWEILPGEQRTPLLSVEGDIVSIGVYPTIQVKQEKIKCSKFAKELSGLSACE